MSKNKIMCKGCYDDHYNCRDKKGCWHFKAARVVKRTEVGTWQIPPYKWRPIKVLDCFHTPERHLLKKNDVRIH